MGTMSYHIYLRILGYITTILMHISNVVFMISSFHGEPMKNAYVRHFSEFQCFFFTCWTFTFQTVHAAFSLHTDILTLKNSKSSGYELPKIIVFLRDAFFSIFVWPSTVLAFTMFWSFFYYDRNLLFPKDIDMVITDTSNHIMHTYIVLASLWEIMFRSRRPPKRHFWYILAVEMLAVVYMLVLIAVHAIWGAWVYPIFGILGGSIYFYLFFVFIGVYLLFIYYAQWSLSSVIWGSQEKHKKLR